MKLYEYNRYGDAVNEYRKEQALDKLPAFLIVAATVGGPSEEQILRSALGYMQVKW